MKTYAEAIAKYFVNGILVGELVFSNSSREKVMRQAEFAKTYQNETFTLYWLT